MIRHSYPCEGIRNGVLIFPFNFSSTSRDPSLYNLQANFLGHYTFLIQ
nr:MAG TPA: hypothetical protein [Crassvirales sp.]